MSPLCACALDPSASQALWKGPQTVLGGQWQRIILHWAGRNEKGEKE